MRFQTIPNIIFPSRNGWFSIILRKPQSRFFPSLDPTGRGSFSRYRPLRRANEFCKKNATTKFNCSNIFVYFTHCAFAII